MGQASDLVEYDPEGHEHTRPDGDWKASENIRPIHDRVIIQRQEPQQTFDGSFIEVPPNQQQKSEQCQVVAKGPKATEVEQGDWVVVHPWAGEPIHHDEMPRLFVVLEEDIEAVIG